MGAAYSSLGQTKVLYAISLVLLGAKAKFRRRKLTASIAQLVERPLSEREVVGSNPAAAPYQRCKKWY